MTTHPITMMPQSELANIVPDGDAGFGALSTARGQLPLRAMDVTGRLVGLVAEIALSQTFVNTLDEPIEATYIFPLPDRAAVTSFRMEVNGRVVQGLIKERGEARRDYDEAIDAGHRAAITEEERSGVFTMRVGNLMPSETAVVRLTMTGPLPIQDGEVTFRFPLVVAPRYIPGTALAGTDVGDGVAHDTAAVPDASRITPPVLLPGYPNPVQLSVRIDVDPAGLPLSNLRSSLHSVVATGEGKTRRVVLQLGERLDRDFILRFNIGSAAIESSLVLAADDEGDEGTFMLTLVPPAVRAGENKPRDVVFVLDRSGSMAGWKMVAARRAVARMVDTLGDADTFNVLAFDTSVEAPPSFAETSLVAATDRNRFRAVEFLAKIDERGGTEMAGPLALAADALAGGYVDRERVLVLVTDGQVGNEDQILRDLAPRLKNVRVFTLGIDRAVNAGFLRRLATLGAGAFELVESEDRLDEVMDKIHRRIATPVVTELQLASQELDIISDTIVPSRIPDLFCSSPVTITGRYRGHASGGLRVSGQDLIGGAWSQTVSPTQREQRCVSRLWARGLIRQLEDQFVVGGPRAELERRIVATSLSHSVLCRFTAFVAVDRDGTVDAVGQPHKVTQPVEMVSGWAGPATMSSELCGAPMPMSAPAGRSYGARKRGAVSSIAAGVGAILGAPIAAAKGLASLSTRTGGGGGDGRRVAEEEREVIDFTSYVKRVRGLVAELQRVSGPEHESQFKRVVAQMRQLVEDLESIDKSLALLRAVAKICREMETKLRAGNADIVALAQTTSDALSSILADHSGAPAARGAFWK